MRRFLLFLAILFPLAVFALVLLLRSSLPERDGVVQLWAVSKPVEVMFDDRGVPHVYAASEADGFAALGYLHAQERLWQMELMRRTVHGRLSEIFGEDTVQSDRLYRTLGLWHAAEADMVNLDPMMRALMDSYVRGINAYISTLRTFRPPEFLLLRYRPEPWELRDSLSILKLLCYRSSANMAEELLRGHMVMRFGTARVAEIMGTGVPFGPTIIPAGTVPEWERGQEPAAQPPSLRLEGPKAASNCFVVAGERSATGKPLLACDPHVDVEIPGLWYEAHMSAAQLDVAGVTVPGLPFVLLGHNRDIAWGLTDMGGDCQDLYQEAVDPKDPTRYRIDQSWFPMLIEKQLIGVRGKEPVRVLSRWTVHGPVITPDLCDYPGTLSLAWTAYHGGQATRAFYEINHAKNFVSFRRALRGLDAPAENVVYADREGNIGFYPAGRLPVRLTHGGVVPTSGSDARYQWSVFMDANRPFLFNPPDGFIVAANNAVIADTPSMFTAERLPAFRAERIRELITGSEKHDIAGMGGIQTDVACVEQKLYRPVWQAVAARADGSEKSAVDMLLKWGGKLDSSPAAALYEAFRVQLVTNTLKDDLEDLYEDYLAYLGERIAGPLAVLDAPDSAWWDDRTTSAVEKRDEIVLKSLREAYESLRATYGEPSSWSWPEMHKLDYSHPLGSSRWSSRLFNRGPYPFQGDSETVNHSGFSYLRPFSVTSTASWRVVMDVSNWDASVSVLASGQSGHPLSANYDDQIDLFRRGELKPMIFSRGKVQQSARSTLRFVSPSVPPPNRR